MVLNLTNFQFSTTEIEAFSLGLKFATDIYLNITTNTILDNYRNCDTDFSKGFIQGIILTAISQTNESSLPKRYRQALSNLTQNPNIIIISPADKSGVVVIMHKQSYIDKINSLLEDTNTYEISNLTHISKNIASFNKFFKKLKEPKNLNIPHQPPYNPNIIWPTHNPQTRHPFTTHYLQQR